MSDDEAIPAQQEIIRNPDGTFPPGVSGNPTGRPKGSVSLVAIARRKLPEMCAAGDKTNAEALVEKWLDDALAGDDKFFKMLLEQIDGKPTQTIHATVDAVPIIDDVPDTRGDGG
jgi:hypothetical protein